MNGGLVDMARRRRTHQHGARFRAVNGRRVMSNFTRRSDHDGAFDGTRDRWWMDFAQGLAPMPIATAVPSHSCGLHNDGLMHFAVPRRDVRITHLSRCDQHGFGDRCVHGWRMLGIPTSGLNLDARVTRADECRFVHYMPRRWLHDDWLGDGREHARLPDFRIAFAAVEATTGRSIGGDEEKRSDRCQPYAHRTQYRCLHV